MTSGLWICAGMIEADVRRWKPPHDSGGGWKIALNGHDVLDPAQGFGQLGVGQHDHGVRDRERTGMTFWLELKRGLVAETIAGLGIMTRNSQTGDWTRSACAHGLTVLVLAVSLGALPRPEKLPIGGRGWEKVKNHWKDRVWLSLLALGQ